jgi:hypothetical protein
MESRNLETNTGYWNQYLLNSLYGRQEAGDMTRNWKTREIRDGVYWILFQLKSFFGRHGEDAAS